MSTATMTPEALTETATEWDRARDEALAELEQVEQSAGADLLDNPKAGETLAGRVASLRARADMAGRAAAEARRRAQDARVAGILADADALTPAVAKARKALQAYEAKRDHLKRELEEFTGHDWQPVPDPNVGELGGTFTRPTRPAERLTAALEEVEARQAGLRAEADDAATDPDWVPPQVRQARRVRAEWDETVAGYREWWQRLADAREEITATARDLRVDLDDLPTPTPKWLADLQRRADHLLEKLAGLPDDVAHARKQGVDLDDAEVSALLREFGLVEDDEAADGEDDPR